jgi:phosphoribosylformimino-5-aminoimidazole carboxamide ribotide isomerase
LLKNKTKNRFFRRFFLFIFAKNYKMIELIPAIDIINGKCVRLSQGNYDQQKTYQKDPLAMAKDFENHGIRRLHLVDLDGAKAQHIVNYNVLEKIALHTQLTIDFGGGLKSNEDLRIAFESGASMITGGSIAVKNESLFTEWLARFGNEKIILGADVKEEKVSVTGWTETTDIQLIPFIENYQKKGIKQIICTDISKDGMLQGVSIDLYKKILKQIPDIHLIASGGVASWKDIEDLEEAHIQAVIFGKAFYEGNITLAEIEKYIL